MEENNLFWVIQKRQKKFVGRGRCAPRVTQHGTQELVTVIKCCCAGVVVLPSFVIYSGAGQYMGWHSETSDPDSVFASSPN